MFVCNPDDMPVPERARTVGCVCCVMWSCASDHYKWWIRNAVLRSWSIAKHATHDLEDISYQRS